MTYIQTHLKRSLLLFLTIALIILPGCNDEPVNEEGPGNETIDNYVGPYCEFMLEQETEGLAQGAVRILIQAPDGTEFERMANHTRTGTLSTLSLTSGLKEGTYRLLAVTSTEGDEETEFGLGSRITVSAHGIEVIDSYNPRLGFAGKGSKEDPYIVSSPSHLFNLMMAVNDYDSNKLISSDTYFSQVRNLDMKTVSRNCDLEYGWIPIGSDSNLPFRGIYLGGNHTVSNLMINRPNTAGIGLFGFVIDATIDGVKMKNSSVTGMYGVGTLAGVVLTSGSHNRGKATFTNCSVEDSKLNCPGTSAAVGGLLGAIDMHAQGLVASCSVSNSALSGGMNVGGIVGGAGLYSSLTATDVKSESSKIKSAYSGAGGIVGTADTLQVVSALNTSEIAGSESNDLSMPLIGTGGIAGGAGFSWLTACQNSGSVSGNEGVGGIIGSTRVKGSDKESFVYNQAYLRHCSNAGSITAKRMAGGLIGEAQAGVETGYNTGVINADDYVGGICGNSSIGVMQNVVNSAPVKGKKYVGGILAKTTWGSLQNCQNLGSVISNDGPTGGILGMGGNNTMIHYCANFGAVTGTDNNSIGGIVGEIGDPREWTATNIVECIVGSLEIAMSFIGPTIAWVEEAVELAHGVEIAIKVVEKVADLALMAADYTLFSYGLPGLISPEMEESLKASMEAGANETFAAIDAEISAIRKQISPTVTLFPSTDFGSYVESIETLTAACADEKTSEHFQDGINEAREERAEQLEKIARAHEIAHTVIAGVAIAVSTATFIAGTVATGGTATAVLAIGTAAAFVGGANALIKTCSEFENNAVVISQCVNAAPVSVGISTNVSSIAGKICDGVKVSDCLSTADTSEGAQGIFVGHAGLHADIENCISAVNRPVSIVATNCHNCLSTVEAPDNTFIRPDGNLTLVAPARLNDLSIYNNLGFEVGNGKRWILPEAMPFPVPGKSCYL